MCKKSKSKENTYELYISLSILQHPCMDINKECVLGFLRAQCGKDSVMVVVD